MIYADSENLNWWKSLPKCEQGEFFERMIDNAPSNSFREFAESLQKQWAANCTLSAKQIASIRKWER